MTNIRMMNIKNDAVAGTDDKHKGTIPPKLLVYPLTNM